MGIYIKDPDAVVDYTVDYGGDGYLLASEVISTSVWEISPAGELDFNVDANGTHDDTTAQVFVKGGIPGDIYKLTNRIVTNNGRTDDRTFQLRVENK